MRLPLRRGDDGFLFRESYSTCRFTEPDEIITSKNQDVWTANGIPASSLSRIMSFYHVDRIRGCKPVKCADVLLRYHCTCYDSDRKFRLPPVAYLK